MVEQHCKTIKAGRGALSVYLWVEWLDRGLPQRPDILLIIWVCWLALSSVSAILQNTVQGFQWDCHGVLQMQQHCASVCLLVFVCVCVWVHVCLCVYFVCGLMHTCGVHRPKFYWCSRFLCCAFQKCTGFSKHYVLDGGSWHLISKLAVRLAVLLHALDDQVNHQYWTGHATGML